MEPPTAARAIHNFTLPSLSPTLASRQDIPEVAGWNARAFMINDFLSAEDCRALIQTATEIANKENGDFENLGGEYPASYRSNSRLLIRSTQFADSLYEKLVEQMKAEDIDDVRPYGFANSGVWKPVKLNDVFKISKYKMNSEFKPHLDGSFVENDQTRSIFTLLIYLNDTYQGGETEFYLHKDKFQIKGKTGSAVIFNHDLRHAGRQVTEGVKYILKTELLFSTTSFIESNVADSTSFQEVAALYEKSDTSEMNGKVDEATAAYIKAIDIQAQDGSIPKETKITKEDDATYDIPQSLALYILSMLPLRSILHLRQVSKRWCKFTRNEDFWRDQYKNRTFSEYTPHIYDSLKKPAFLVDWYHIFASAYKAQKHPVLIIDLGPNMIRMKAVNKEPVEAPNVMSVAETGNFGGHYTAFSKTFSYGSVALTDRHPKIFPMQYPTLINWEKQFKIIQWMLSKKQLKLGLENTRVIFAESSPAFKANGTVYDYSHNEMKIPSVCVVPAPVLALFATGRQTGIAIDCGTLKDLSEPIVLSPVVAGTMDHARVRRISYLKILNSEIHKMLTEFLAENNLEAVPLVLYNTQAGQLLPKLEAKLQKIAILACADPRFAVVEGGELFLASAEKKYEFIAKPTIPNPTRHYNSGEKAKVVEKPP